MVRKSCGNCNVVRFTILDVALATCVLPKIFFCSTKNFQTALVQNITNLKLKTSLGAEKLTNNFVQNSNVKIKIKLRITNCKNVQDVCENLRHAPAKLPPVP